MEKTKKVLEMLEKHKENKRKGLFQQNIYNNENNENYLKRNECESNMPRGKISMREHLEEFKTQNKNSIKPVFQFK